MECAVFPRFPPASPTNRHTNRQPPILLNAFPDPWPHAPPHHFTPRGIYVVTAATCHREPLFTTPEKLDLFRGTIFEFFAKYGVRLQAWAFLSNHYHVVMSFEDAAPGAVLSKVLREAHYEVACPHDYGPIHHPQSHDPCSGAL